MLMNDIITAIAVGVWWGIVHYSGPLRWLLKWSKLDQFELFTCTICSGYWVSLIMLALVIKTPFIIILAGISSLAAHLTQKQLWT